MKIQSTGVKLTEGMKDVIIDKFNFLEKNFSEIKCFIASEPKKEVKLTIQFVDNYNHHFRAHSIGEFYSTLDELKAKIKRLISKRKTLNKLIEQELPIEIPELTK